MGSSPIVSTEKTLVGALRCAPPEVQGARRAIRVPLPCHNWERTGGAGAALAYRWQRLMSFERITTDPGQMGGQPRIRGLRMPAASVVAMVADGMTADEIVREHPDLENEDVAEALRYAAQAARKQELPRYLDE